MSDENNSGGYNYITPEHTHNSGQVGRDVFTTDQPATLSNRESRESGLPKAHEIGEKTHLNKGQDY